MTTVAEPQDGIIVDLVSHTTRVTPQEIDAAVAGWQAQISADLQGAWGVAAALRVAAHPDPSHWFMLLADTTDQQDALGYHVVSPSGLPQGIAFVATAAQAGVDWRSVVSHELLEMLVDPYAMLAAQSGEAFWACEICDPVEDRTYVVHGIPVSDFVTPRWFVPGAPGPYDRLGAVARPLAVTPGGYASVWTQGAWGQVSGGMRRDFGDPRKSLR
jgi:hypothetical protein